ncbi:MAG: UDP-N-acetylglucosamine--N-acetylmuramyl-(pentapeptide) pyrophosphoryl-undecaprenol N-acetylglucosamine transferase [Brevinematales bacterium]|nr:UDP-N-acetylglucosamine--N-acetylmuramyl-(pentapeptide) pyrophosphoryl-undecaprenol N-acetylglucosamine transferase [Brevinematales bacterium]
MENHIKKKQIKCIVAGGKTGGHLIPGIAVYRALKEKNIDVRYVLNSSDIKFPVVKNIDENDRIFLEISSISRKLSLKTIFDLFKILKAFFKIFGRILNFNPDAIIITGGYISNPVALSSIILFKPLYILEQNSVAGITNRFYSLFAKKVFTSFEKTLKIPEKKVIYTGNPILYNEKIEKGKAKKFFDLDNYDKVIGIMSGSQGAKIVNNTVLEVLDFLKNKNIGVIWSLGAVEYERLKDFDFSKFPNVRIHSFIERMDYFYSAIDLVISRAGATSISEIMFFEVLSIFIPIKNSPDNHQELNAKTLVDKKVAKMIFEDSLTPDILINNLTDLLDNIINYKSNFNNFEKKNKLPQHMIVEEIIRGEKWQY